MQSVSTDVFKVDGDRARLRKFASITFSVDTWCTTQSIIERFDAAGLDVESIVSVQHKNSNNT